MIRKVAGVLLGCTLVGCATSFTGEAHVEGGPAGCKAKCEGWGLEFAGMVAMGEYSDACVCHVRGAQVSHADVGAIGGAAAGVAMQMERQRAAATVP